MTLRGSCFCVLVVVVCAMTLVRASAQDPPPDQSGQGTPPPAESDQVFRGAVDFVRVDAYPRRDGRVVEGLTADDFEVFEDGEPQTIATFEFVRHAPDPGYDRVDPRNRAEAERWMADPERRLFVIYVDYYHITLAASHQIREPLMQVLREAIGPSDLVALVTPEARIEDIAFVQTLNSISSDLLRYWESGLADMPVQPRTAAENQLAACGNSGTGYEQIIRRFRDDVFFTSLESLIAHMGALRQDRTNVILLSEGWRNTQGGVDLRNWNGLPGGRRSPISRQIGTPTGTAGTRDQFGRPTGDVPAARAPSCTELLVRLEVDYDDRFRRLFRLANANNVAFHTIDVGGLRTGGPTAANPTSRDRAFTPNPFVLQELAENTGGIATVNANDIASGLRRVVDHTSSYYLLGYASTNTARDGQYREIDVRVDSDDVSVTARRGYTAVSDELERVAAERAVREAVPSATAEAIGSLSRWDAGEPLLVRALDTGEGIDVIVEIDEREYANGPWRAGGAIDVEFVDSSGRETVRRSARLEPGLRAAVVTLLRDATDAAPERTYVRLHAEDVELTSRVDITPPSASRVGQPRFFRIPASGRPVPHPVVAPVFRRPERMRIEWPLSVAPGAQTVQLTDRRGQPLEPGAALSHTVDSDRGVLVVDLYTAALAEGDYALDVGIRVGDTDERQVVAFRVDR